MSGDVRRRPALAEEFMHLGEQSLKAFQLVLYHGRHSTLCRPLLETVTKRAEDPDFRQRDKET
jgi:hypothetical protein